MNVPGTWRVWVIKQVPRYSVCLHPSRVCGHSTSQSMPPPLDVTGQASGLRFLTCSSWSWDTLLQPNVCWLESKPSISVSSTSSPLNVSTLHRHPNHDFTGLPVDQLEFNSDLSTNLVILYAWDYTLSYQYIFLIKSIIRGWWHGVWLIL